MSGILSPVFSFDTRPSLVRKLQTEIFDVLVIGGGITGAAVARDAAFRGLKVALIEAGDFASGTSSGSSKLIHGGLRYLEQFEFKLVFEAIQEREKLEKLYAPLVQDLPFVFPTYAGRFPSRLKLNLGLFLYDSFAKFRAPHQNLSASETKKKFPWLKESLSTGENLSGACVYIDSFAEDYRLVIELIKAAARKEAQCVSRLSVCEIKPGAPHLVRVRDLTLAETEFEIKTKSIFNCSGPFSDSVRKLLNLPPALRLTQGVHFIIPRSKLPIATAFVLSDPKLHRILFAIPWNSVTYLGTTDTEIDNPLAARAQPDDAKYILEIVNSYFNLNLTRKDFIQSWAAVRPLLKPPSSESPSSISREHHIEENPKGIFHIMGGKLTSHRLMAREALDSIYESSHPCSIENVPLQDEFFKKANPSRLEQTFGRYATDILELDHRRDLKQQKMSNETEHLISEVLYSIHHEMALTALDFLRRRSSLYYENPDLKTAQIVNDLFAGEMKWNDEIKNKSLEEVKRSLVWDKEGY